MLYLEALHMIYSSKCETGDAKKRNIVNSTFTATGTSIHKPVGDGCTTRYTMMENGQIVCNRWGITTTYSREVCDDYEVWTSGDIEMTLKYGEFIDGYMINVDAYRSAYIHPTNDNKN